MLLILISDRNSTLPCSELHILPRFYGCRWYHLKNWQF